MKMRFVDLHYSSLSKYKIQGALRSESLYEAAIQGYARPALAMVPWYHGTMVQYHGTMVPWYNRYRLQMALNLFSTRFTEIDARVRVARVRYAANA